MQEILSGILLALLIIMLMGRAVIMQKKGIKAIVFGKTDKSDFLLLPVVLFLVYSVIAGLFNLPMWQPLVLPFWNTIIPGYLACCVKNNRWIAVPRNAYSAGITT